MFNQNETWWSTTLHADGTARTSILRFGDAPDADNQAWEEAVQIADRLASGEDPEAHFARACRLPPGAERTAAYDAYCKEIRLRTIPGEYKLAFAPKVFGAT